MKIPENLEGQRFGTLNVEEYIGRYTPAEMGFRGTAITTWWRVRCDCGEFFPVRAVQLKDKRVTACKGCQQKKPKKVRSNARSWQGTSSVSPFDPFYDPLDPIISDWVET